MTDSELVATIQDHPDRAVTASEVAEELGFTSQGVGQRLNRLHDRGVVEKKTVGARAVVWWVDSAQDGETSDCPAEDNQ